MGIHELSRRGKNVIATADWICAVLLALLPILQHYRGLINMLYSALLVNVLPSSFSKLAAEDTMTVSCMLLMAPYLAVRIFSSFRKENLKGLILVAPLIVFYIYKVVDHGTSVSELFQVALSVGYLVALGFGCIDLKKFVKSATVVGCVAGAGMIVQYVCYYVFGFHLQMVPDKLLLPSAEQWVKLVQTGHYSVTGHPIAFYRTSAIFLEPSHLFIYCFPLLFINLYKNGKTPFNWVASVLVSVAIVLSTSGMGVAVIFGAWVLFATLWDAKTDLLKISSLKKGRQWLRGICTALVMLVLFLNIPSINSSIARIIGHKSISISLFIPSLGSGTEETIQPGQADVTTPTGNEPTGNETTSDPTVGNGTVAQPIVTDKNAVSGRVKYAVRALKKMSIVQWIFGCSDTTTEVKAHMPGFFSIAYRYGIIGLLLSYFIFAYALFKVDAGYFWMAAIWFVVSFFSAHTHGMSYLLFYVMFVINGHQENTGAWAGELKSFFCGFVPRRLRNRIETRDEE